MATYRVGQRVKRIRSSAYGVPVGAEGTVIAYPGGKNDKVEYSVDIAWDNPTYERIGVWVDTIAPLTDPGADEFIENMERFARVVPRVPVVA